MNPQMLMALLQGQLTKDGSGAGSMGQMGSAMAGGMGGLAPMLLMLAGMGIREIPRLLNAIMDYTSSSAEAGQSQENPGALPTPPEAAPASPQGMPGAMPPEARSIMGFAGAGAPAGGLPPGAGGPPPGLVPMLMQIAAQRGMQRPPMA